MSLVFPVKDALLPMPKAKTVVFPKMFMTAGYDNECLVGKLPPPKQAAFDAAFDKVFTVKFTEARGKLDKRMKDLASAADKQVPALTAEESAKFVADLQKEVERYARDLGVDLKFACTGAVAEGYKQTMTQQLGKQIAATGNVKVEGKAKLTADAAEDLKGEADGVEVAGKTLTGLVPQIQDNADGVVADSHAAQPMLTKAIKDCNTLSKSMKEYAKKKSPADEKTIDTTMKGLDKTLDTLEKLVSASLTRTRQAKLKLGGLDGVLKDLKRPDISNAIKLCIADAQGILDLLNGFNTAKPVIDAIGKPWDETKIPEFPKLITALNRLDDPEPSKKWIDHLNKMTGMIEEASKG